MNKAQMETKLSLLPLNSTVEVSYAVAGEDDHPVMELSYPLNPGPGWAVIQVDIEPTEQQLKDIVANLPLPPQDQLASLAIMLTPPLSNPVEEP
jgi:hypothetical protein